MSDEDDMVQNLLMSQVEADFGVKLFAHRVGQALFGALRKKTWHFITATFKQDPDDKNFTHTNIVQLHVPRFVMARELRSLMTVQKLGEPGFPISGPLADDISVILYPSGRVDFSLMDSGDRGLSNKISDYLKQDIPVFDKSLEKVKDSKDGYSLPRAKSVHGNPVTHSSQRLIHAIAFERETMGRLDAKKFGIYSAFCTMVDFPYSEEFPEDLVCDLIRQQFQASPDDVQADIQDMFSKVQSELFKSPIWGRGVSVSLDAAVPILADALRKLNRGQRTQLLLMNGMHNAWLFVSLAAIIGTISFARYLEIMTKTMEPDSEEEQSFRSSGAFIDLFGNLA